MSRRAPWGLLAALAVVAILEARLGASADRLAGYEGLAVRFAAEAAAGREARSCDVLAVGDSVIKFGFDPAEVERRTGLTAYNLAAPGTPPPLALALFRKALDAGATPKALVIGQMSLAGDPRAHVAPMGEAAGAGECLTLAWWCRDGGLFGSMMAARALPSVRYRPALVAALGGGLRIEVAPESRRKGWTEARGAELRPQGVAFDGRLDPAFEARVYARPWRVEPVYERSLRGLAELARSRGVGVFWVVPPIVPGAQAKREALGFDALHTRNLHAIHARMPGVVVLDARHAGFADADFFDAVHLNARGASRLSREVAGAIAERLKGSDGPRWVEFRKPADARLVGPPPNADRHSSLRPIGVSQSPLREDADRRRGDALTRQD